MGIAVVGAVGVAMVCPGIVHLIPKEYQKRYSYKSVRQAVLRLDKKGWIVARQMGTQWKIHLSKKGWDEFRAYEFARKQLEIPKTWDKKWRLLIFDIPEKRKFIREKVRRFLRSLNFHRLQDSVWVYPYECQDILDLLRTRYEIRFEALYLTVHSFDHDHWLRKQFEVK